MAPALRAIALSLRAFTTCPASPTCPENDQCSLTSNGVTFQVSCATDYYGGDLQLAQTSSLASCAKACSTTTGCIAASYVNGNCYLKSTLNAAQPNPNVIGVAVVGREDSTSPEPAPAVPKTCSTGFTCPEDDGCSYTSGSRTLTLTCGVDFYGGDLSNEYSASLEACTQSCANNAQCVAASFVGGKGAGSCYLKDTKNGGSRNDNVDVIYVVPSVVQPSTSAISSTPSPSLTVASSAVTSSTVESSTVESSTITSSTVASSTVASSTVASSTVASSTVASSTVASSTVASSTVASSTVASSTIAPSAAASSSTPPGPIASNFCLKVITPDIPQTGFIVKATGLNSNYIWQGPTSANTPYYGNVGFFTLEQSGALSVVDTDRVLGITSSVSGSTNQSFRQFTPAQLATNPSRPIAASCSLVGGELKCIARTTQNDLNTFILPKSATSSGNIFGLADARVVATSMSSRQVSVGVAFGADCVV